MEKNTAIHVLARAVIIKDGQLLVNINTKLTLPFYFLPGGHIEHGETAQDALARELQEELGFSTQVQKFLCTFEYSFVPNVPSKCHSHEYNFLYEVRVPELQAGIVPVSPEDHTHFAWIPLNELQDTDFRPVMLKNILLEWLQTGTLQPFSSSMEL